jgi:hypothetical protein
MSLSLLLAAILLLSLAGFAINRQRVAALAGSGTATHSRPSYHGTYALLTILVVGPASRSCGSSSSPPSVAGCCTAGWARRTRRCRRTS